MKLNPRVKQLWLEDLRTTTVEQGKVALRNIEDQYCCLGRLCEIAVAEGVIDPPVLRGASWEYDGDDAGLPGSVIVWAFDLDAEKFADSRDRGSYIFVSVPHAVNSEWDNLAAMNDNGYTFPEIADVVEGL